MIITFDYASKGVRHPSYHLFGIKRLRAGLGKGLITQFHFPCCRPLQTHRHPSLHRSMISHLPNPAKLKECFVCQRLTPHLSTCIFIASIQCTVSIKRWSKSTGKKIKKNLWSSFTSSSVCAPCCQMLEPIMSLYAALHFFNHTSDLSLSQWQENQCLPLNFKEVSHRHTVTQVPLTLSAHKKPTHTHTETI